MSNLESDKLRKPPVLLRRCRGRRRVSGYGGRHQEGRLVAVLGAIIGVVLGTGIWRCGIRLRFIRRFQREGMPRIRGAPPARDRCSPVPA